MKPWMAVDDRLLRRHYATANLRELADRLGRTYVAMRCRANKIGLKTHRKQAWTEAEKAFLRANYGPGKMTARQCAEALGRTLAMVFNRVFILRLNWHHRTVIDAAFLRRVKRLHASGLTDAEIARKVGCERHVLNRVRQQLGLAVNAEGVRRIHRANNARQRITLGIKNPVELWLRAHQRYAREHGWPEDLGPRAVQILDALYALGPRTRLQLAVDIGLPRARRGELDRISLNQMFMDNGAVGRGANSYFGTLAAMGLVCVIGGVANPNGPAFGKGSAKKLSIYSLTIKALRMKGDFLDQQNQQRQRSQSGVAVDAG